MESKCQTPILMKRVLCDAQQTAANDEAQLGVGNDEDGDGVGVGVVLREERQRRKHQSYLKPVLSYVCLATANDQLGEGR